jgi:hypothetical protein
MTWKKVERHMLCSGQIHADEGEEPRALHVTLALFIVELLA